MALILFYIGFYSIAVNVALLPVFLAHNRLFYGNLIAARTSLLLLLLLL